MCQSLLKALSSLLLRILPALHPFHCSLMIFHLHYGTMKSLVNYVKLQMLCRWPLSLFIFFVEAMGCSGFILQTWRDFCPFLYRSSAILAGTMSLHLWLNKVACAQPGWNSKVRLDRSRYEILSAHEPWGEENISEHKKLARSIPGDSA